LKTGLARKPPTTRLDGMFAVNNGELATNFTGEMKNLHLNGPDNYNKFVGGSWFYNFSQSMQ
jgi:hypothetical protein